MKKFFAITLSCVLMMALFAGCGGGTTPSSPAQQNPSTTPSTSTTPEPTSNPPAGDKVVKIGIFEPLSGDNGAGGKQEALGMEYANYETPTVEIAGEVYTVELVPADNQSANDKAPSAAQTLVSAGVSLVLGSYGSGVSMAASSVFEDSGIAAIGVSCTNPGVTEGNSHYFRICFLDPFQGTVLANFAKDEFSATKAYVLAKQGDDYSVGLGNYFMDAFGKENCVYDTFPEGTSDYSSYVANAKTQGCDVFFSPVSTEAAALIIDQANTQDLGMPILAGDTWDSNVVTQAAQGKKVNVYVTTFYQEGGSPAFDSGIKAWINSNSTAKANNGGNDDVAAVTALGYDAYYMALEILKTAGNTDPGAVLSVTPGVTYTGVTGLIAFDATGDAMREVAFVKTCDSSGTWKFVKQQGV